MKNLLGVVLLVVSVSSPVWAGDTFVHGYMRQNGTYVQPYMRTAPDNSLFNNYSTQGNINPYTGQMGTVNPYAPSESSGGGIPNNPYSVSPIYNPYLGR